MCMVFLGGAVLPLPEATGASYSPEISSNLHLTPGFIDPSLPVFPPVGQIFPVAMYFEVFGNLGKIDGFNR